IIIAYHINVIGSPQFISAFNTGILTSFIGIFTLNILFLLLQWFILIGIFWIIAKYFFIKRSFSETFKVITHSFIPLILSRLILVFIVYFGLGSITVTETTPLTEIPNLIALLFQGDMWLFYRIVDYIMWYWSGFIILYAISELNKIEIKKAGGITFSVITIIILFSIFVG
ncbi:MAG: YIP1 family protein, partial [Candidatus Odinarchaeia archaeon]